MFGDVLGLEVVMPSSVNDAARLLLASIQSDLPITFVKSKPLYDLMGEVELPVQLLPLGQPRIVREGDDITFVAILHMVEFAKGVAQDLVKKNIQAEVLDLRTLSPLDENQITASVKRTGHVAVFDVGWQKFGLASEVSRVICMTPACRLISPLVSVGQKWEHSPGGCFREYEHYPIQQQVASDLLRLF
jgi:pyruvate/2-oxoglutarate/acetoin dehydrogenase E1 component